VIPALSRTPIVGYGAVVAAILAMVFLSFGLWVHHMFTVGIPHLALAFFSAASMLVAVPTAVQIFAWIGTLWRGRPELKLPMLYVLGFFLTFVMGGLTGVMLAVVPFNWQAHDTDLRHRAPALCADRRLRLPHAGGHELVAADDDRTPPHLWARGRRPS